MFATEATTPAGMTPSALDFHAYNANGGWMSHIAAFRNNGTTDFYGPVNASGKITSAGRDLLAEIDALKAGSAGNASKAGTDTNKAIEDLGKIAAQLLAGGATVPGNLAITSNLTVGGNLAITSNLTVGGGLTTTGGLKLGGPLSYKTSVWNPSDDGINRLYFEPNNHTYFGSNNEFHFDVPNGPNRMILDKAGNLTLAGGISGPGWKIDNRGYLYLDGSIVINTPGHGINFTAPNGKKSSIIGSSSSNEREFLESHHYLNGNSLGGLQLWNGVWAMG